MKKVILILVAIVSIASCKDVNKNKVSTDNSSAKTQTVDPKPISNKEIVSNNNLCKINGKDWAYTKASGIIDIHRKTKKRTAIITFKKKLAKGSESIQLYYNADSFELEGASLQLKVKKKNNKLATYFYDIKPSTRKLYPQTKLSGSIDLSNTTKASGVAKIINIATNKYDKKSLLNADDAEVTITDLKFTDIGYSDLDKVFKALKK